MKEMRDCEEAAKELFSGRAVVTADTEKEKKAKEPGELCPLPGCKKPVDGGKATNRYCSRRHYYEHLHVMGERKMIGERLQPWQSQLWHWRTLDVLEPLRLSPMTVPSVFSSVWF